jgi:hypothetical protein
MNARKQSGTKSVIDDKDESLHAFLLPPAIPSF